MNPCLEPLVFIGDMLEAVRTARKDGEMGFVMCRGPGPAVSMGSRCVEKGNHCTIQGNPCPGGGRPVVSFHTHTTEPTAMALAMEENPLSGDAAKVMLLPSTKDIAADAGLGVNVGCIGGRLNDGTQEVWCFPTFPDRDARERASDNVHLLQDRLGDAMRKARAGGGDAAFYEILADYFTLVGTPCLELRLPEGDEK